MKEEKYSIGDIFITIKNKIVFASICLESTEIERLSKLIELLSVLKEAGFTKYATSYFTGYYNSVESISLEFYEPISRINLDVLEHNKNKIKSNSRTIN